jgi:signal transduction histidine kinase
MDAANRRDVKILNAMPENLPQVEADFDKISWVLNNLISNALKYTESGDTVTILADAGADSVTVSVRDTGSGIYPEYIEHIFDKFYQANDGQIEARGTGLGLYVAREIVQAHKGEISVSSKPGEGSIFSFTLPVAGEGKEQ